jgi:hypothetical protein
VIERLLAPLGSFDKYFQLSADFFLADVFIELFVAQRAFQRTLGSVGETARQ